MDIGYSAGMQKTDIEIWELCDQEKKASESVCNRARNEFFKEAEVLCSKGSLELEELIKRVGELSQRYINLIKEIVQRRGALFTERISTVYIEGSNEKNDSIIKSFSEVSNLFTDIIEFEILQKELEHKIALGAYLKTKISTQRSVKEEKNQAKADQLRKVNHFLRRAQTNKNLIDEKLAFVIAHKPKSEVSKIYIDQLETKMNILVMNARKYAQKIEVASGNLTKAEHLLAESVLRLTSKSEALNSIAEKYFERKEGEGEDKLKITEGDVIDAIHEFEKASCLVERVDGLCYIVEKDVENLKNIALLKSGSVE